MIKVHQRNNFKYRINLLSHPTKEELVVHAFLEEISVPFIFQKGFLKPFHRIVDFYLPKKKIIIEVDGGYHEKCGWRDTFKDITFRECRKMKTIRITNDCVRSGEFKKIILDNLYGL